MTGIHHIGLTATDFARSKAFYTTLFEKLGAAPVMETQGAPHKHEGQFAFFMGPGLAVSLWEATNKAREFELYSVGLHHLAFSAPSRAAVDELYGFLQQRGVGVLDPPAEYPYMPGYYALYFVDPDGIKLEYVFVPQG